MDGYLLFGGETYYPKGGWSDYIGAFRSEAEAAAAFVSDGDMLEGHWFHVVKGGVIVSEHRSRG